MISEQRRIDTGSTTEAYIPIGVDDSCGHYMERTHPNDGRHFWFQWRCRKFRECQECLELRATKYISRLLQFISHGIGNSVIEIAVPTKAATERIIRQLPKDAYLRLPMLNGSYIMFLDRFYQHVIAADYPRTILETDRDVLALDWQALVYTPQGARITGHLGQYVLPAAGEVVRGEVLYVETDATPDEKDDAWVDAVYATPDVPTDAQSAFTAMNARTQAYADALQLLGAQVRLTKRVERIQIVANIKPELYLISSNLLELGIDGYGRGLNRTAVALTRRVNRLH